MKLLFDQNLSHKLRASLNDVFPDSEHVRSAGLDTATDSIVWRYAATGGYIFVTQDSDFAEMAALYGPPPKIIWLRCGNVPTQRIGEMLRQNAAAIENFVADDAAACLEVY